MQSTLSAGIRDLETVLGIPMAERTKRVVLMTPMGLEIAARARQLLRDAGDIMDLAALHQEPMSGDMKLGVIPTIGPFLLPNVLPKLGKTYPGLRLYLREEQTALLLTRLRDGEIDLALIALPFDIEGMTVRKLFDDPFQFACHAENPLAGYKSISDDDLLDQPLLLLEEGHCLRDHALKACQLNGSFVREQFEATSLLTLVQMVEAGLGVTLLPQLAIDAGIISKTTVDVIPLSETTLRQIVLVWRASSPRVGEFELLAKIFQRPSPK